MAKPDWKTYTVPPQLLLPDLHQLNGGSSGARTLHIHEPGIRGWLIAVVESPPPMSVLVPHGTVPEPVVQWFVCFEGNVAASGQLSAVDAAKSVALRCFVALGDGGEIQAAPQAH